MKKTSLLCILLILSLLFVGLTGCSQDQANSSGSKKTGETTEARDAKQTDASKSIAANADKTASADNKDDENTPLNNYEKIPEEQRNAMADITGKWQLQTPTDGGTHVIKAKFDNVGGFTLATGDANSEYAHVGSYEIEGDKITMSATTGGPSNGDDSYELRMDPAVFEYTYSLNPEKTQLVLTPQNDNAKGLTGQDAITLSKS